MHGPGLRSTYLNIAPTSGNLVASLQSCPANMQPTLPYKLNSPLISRRNIMQPSFPIPNSSPKKISYVKRTVPVQLLSESSCSCAADHVSLSSRIILIELIRPPHKTIYRHIQHEPTNFIHAICRHNTSLIRGDTTTVYTYRYPQPRHSRDPSILASNMTY